MNNFFSNRSEHSSHIYIADYTQQTQSERGVEISDDPFNDIQYCTFKNPRNTTCWGINFERNSGVFRIDGTSQSAPQCECMIASKNAQKKAWVCLMEMKYCLEKNVDSNSENAFNQLIACFNYLKGKGIIDLKRHRVYLNISIPDHSNKQPFNSFSFSQNRILELKKNERVQFLGYNEIKILNEAYLEPSLT